jgi:hypothetical protein
MGSPAAARLPPVLTSNKQKVLEDHLTYSHNF